MVEWLDHWSDTEADEPEELDEPEEQLEQQFDFDHRDRVTTNHKPPSFYLIVKSVLLMSHKDIVLIKEALNVDRPTRCVALG
jgi:hypothetical protein